jgi:hypothetical protein
VTLARLEEDAAQGAAGRHVIEVEKLLPGAPAVVVLPEAEARVGNGSVLEPGHFRPAPGWPAGPADAPLVRVFAGSGRLLALARPRAEGPGLHAFLVLS